MAKTTEEQAPGYFKLVALNLEDPDVRHHGIGQIINGVRILVKNQLLEDSIAGNIARICVEVASLIPLYLAMTVFSTEVADLMCGIPPSVPNISADLQMAWQNPDMRSTIILAFISHVLITHTVINEIMSGKTFKESIREFSEPLRAKLEFLRSKVRGLNKIVI